MECGNDSFAIKCFKKDIPDLKDRYALLSNYLNTLSLPALTNFTYLSDAICVGGRWYPIIRMEWADAQQLDQYVEQHLKNKGALARLGVEFRKVLEDLAQHEIAHGDLQHGNILVGKNGEVRLVDYDGMYIPPLQNMPAQESGHHNYQHPIRYQNGYFAPDADSFASIVIYTSLCALEKEPDLWQFYNGDNLIFSADDFRNPGSTPLWQRLASSSSGEVRQLAGELENYCQGSLASIPTLENLLTSMLGLAYPQGGATSIPVPSSAPSHAPTGAWWLQNSPSNQIVSAPAISSSPPVANAPTVSPRASTTSPNTFPMVSAISSVNSTPVQSGNYPTQIVTFYSSPQTTQSPTNVDDNSVFMTYLKIGLIFFVTAILLIGLLVLMASLKVHLPHNVSQK